MKNRTLLPMIVLVFLVLAFLPKADVWAQLPPTADAYINETSASNFGAAATLQVSQANFETFIQFDLSSLPNGTTASSVGRATLVLYAGAVTSAGSFDVYEVGGAWNELTINNTTEPPLGVLIVSAVPITTADKNNFVVIDVTQAVKDWLNGTVVNNGLALQPNGSAVNVTFNSKENTITSHSPQLNISLVEPPGNITQITAGAGLAGGGITGNVSLGVDSTQVPFLSFPNTFTANQTVAGNLTASSFIGNGLSLTNVNASLLRGLPAGSFANLAVANTFSTTQNFLGNVGIGTTTPKAQLDVVGNGNFQGMILSNADSPTYSPSFNPISQNTPGSPGVVFQAGTSNSTDAFEGIYFNTFGNDNGPPGAQVTRAVIAGRSGGDWGELSFHTMYGGEGQLYERMRIDQHGNVGIGTRAPSFPLDVVGSLKIEGSGNGIVFPDGTTQGTAEVQGPQGIQGLKGDKGDKGATGPPGPPVHTMAVCLIGSGSPPSCPHGYEAGPYQAPCTVTSDTGTCGGSQGPNGIWGCAVCKP